MEVQEGIALIKKGPETTPVGVIIEDVKIQPRVTPTNRTSPTRVQPANQVRHTRPTPSTYRGLTGQEWCCRYVCIALTFTLILFVFGTSLLLIIATGTQYEAKFVNSACVKATAMCSGDDCKKQVRDECMTNECLNIGLKNCTENIDCTSMNLCLDEVYISKLTEAWTRDREVNYKDKLSNILNDVEMAQGNIDGDMTNEITGAFYGVTFSVLLLLAVMVTACIFE